MSPVFIDMAQLETAPPFAAGHKVDNCIPALQFLPTNNNVMKYKYIPTAADGESGIKFRMMLDVKNAREARRKARRLNDKKKASYAGQDTQPKPQGKGTGKGVLDKGKSKDKGKGKSNGPPCPVIGLPFM